ncbi:zinc finger and BTB domain-containing protein 43-like [Melanotaenia boesemani]|uniref:zinc finger and BTB domain-containing protein 43-like n=1 Tax=Melanotaenia boesemani TaxID=1250792 RepID=UPI001C03F51F|nr:zinc finger and BTB domain-containing protein 43-like [Melanotaenia boesemani]
MDPCAQEVSHHAASLLTCLNHQREQALFCDCVLKHKQSSGQLYPAHRCVLAASSPVFASVLSSTGALVELQDPCLSDSVLALLLDYVYTGTLPYTQNQQQYYRLLTAACHLQMNELQEALRVAWQQTEMNATDDVSASTGAEIHSYSSINDSYRSFLKTFRDPPSSPSTDAFKRFEEPSKLCSVRATILDEAQMNSVSLDSRVKAGETCTSKNIVNHCSRTDASILESNDSMNLSEYRQAAYTTVQNLMQDTSDTAEEHDASEVNKVVHEDQFQSDGFEKLEIWQKHAEDELLVTSENKKCCGAVPVICHSSRVAVHQLAEECAVFPYHPAFQSSVSSSRSPISRSVSTGNENTVDCMTTNQKDRFGAQNLDLRYNEKP